jgi:ParB family chromosome partitioning protein
MTLDCLMAFAISDDHKQQEEVWKELRQWCRNAASIRSTLTEAHIEADSKLARFATVAAYEASGGAVLRDLFDTDSAGWITDPALLNRLAGEKLEREAASIRAQGWKWVEIVPDLSWDTLRSFDRIHPTPTKAQQAALDKLQRQLEEAEGDEEAYDDLSARLDTLESEIAFTAADKATSGVIVSIDHEGVLEIIPGLVRREDREPKKKKAEGDGDAANAPPCFSAKLIEDLTAHRTAALQAMLADNPKVALAAVTHAPALGVFYQHDDNLSSLRIAPGVVDLDRSAEGIAATSSWMKVMPAPCGRTITLCFWRMARSRISAMAQVRSA